MRKERKRRGFATESHQLKYGGSRTCFSFRICRKHQGFATFGDWKYGEKRKKRSKRWIVRTYTKQEQTCMIKTDLLLSYFTSSLSPGFSKT